MSRFDEVTEVSPEPMPVIISGDRCPTHDFAFISMPRNEGEHNYYFGLAWKCPIKNCMNGR